MGSDSAIFGVLFAALAIWLTVRIVNRRERWAIWTALALLAGTALSLWAYTSATGTIWDGHFQLTVNLSSNAGPLESVTCRAISNRVRAEWVAENPSLEESRLWCTTVDPFNGMPLTVTVPVSGRTSLSRRALSRSQFEYLVVIGRLQDGRSIGKVVAIPDGRISRQVSVSLP